MKKKVKNKGDDLFDIKKLSMKNVLDSKFLIDKILTKKNLTLGQRTSDILTKWGGSWYFIFSFLAFLLIWMFINAYFLIQYGYDSFDPYPFILLNLVLSCLAAIQAPIILMSQNRAAERDRLRVEYDYAVNRKAEKEIRDVKKSLESIKRKLNYKK
jgi:uncharacterized membrane protein